MHRPIRIPLVAGLLAILALSACQRAHTDFDAEKDFSNYKTFALSATKHDNGGSFAPEFTKIIQEVSDEVILGMKARGLLIAAPATADLIVTPHIEVVPYKSSADTRIKGRDLPARKLGPIVLAPYSVTQIDSEAVNREMREGTLLINVTDMRTRKLVWQGWISQVFDLNKLREKEWTQTPGKGYLRYRRRTIQKSVKRILSDFPPAP